LRGNAASGRLQFVIRAVRINFDPKPSVDGHRHAAALLAAHLHKPHGGKLIERARKIGPARFVLRESSATDCGFSSRMMRKSSRFSGVSNRSKASADSKLTVAASAGAGFSPRATAFISLARSYIG